LGGADKARNRIILSLPFLIPGIFWVSIVLLNEGSMLLIVPGIISLFVAAVLIMGIQSNHIKRLCIAVGLYNLVIFVYQTYASTQLIGLGLVTAGAVEVVGYGVATVILLLSLFIMYSKYDALMT
jgi:hypothetical protein